MNLRSERLGPAMRNPLIVLAALVLATAGGCRSTPKSRSDGQAPAEPPEETLRARATTLWNAKIAEDWETVFLFETLREDSGATKEQFLEYCRTTEPFRIHACEVGRVVVEDGVGWVELNVRSSMRRFPNAPPVVARRWETWRLDDGTWMPVPPKEVEDYVSCPLERDLEDEPALRKRFDEAWAAREAGDWEKLYTYVDPRDLEVMNKETWVNTHDLINFLTCKVDWVEARGGVGVVRARIEHKLTDPSMTKLPPHRIVLREDWVKHDGQWYIDYRRD